MAKTKTSQSSPTTVVIDKANNRLGYCQVHLDRGTTNIQRVYIKVIGEVRSYRDKAFSSRSTAIVGKKITQEQSQWFMKLRHLQAVEALMTLQGFCRGVGKKVQLEAYAHRHHAIKDKKNLVAGFDHAVLDALVRGKCLADDCDANLVWNIHQCIIDKGVEQWLELDFSVSRYNATGKYGKGDK